MLLWMQKRKRHVADGVVAGNENGKSQAKEYRNRQSLLNVPQIHRGSRRLWWAIPLWIRGDILGPFYEEFHVLDLWQKELVNAREYLGRPPG